MECLYFFITIGLVIFIIGFGRRMLFGSVPVPAKSAAPRVNNGSLYILPEWRLALLNLLRRIRSDEDPIAALENALNFIEQGTWLPIHAPIPDIGNVTVRESISPAEAFLSSVPVDSAPVMQPSVPISAPTPTPVALPVLMPMMAAEASPMATPITPIPPRVPNPPAGRLEATPPPPTPKRDSAPPPKSPPLFTLPSLPTIEMPDNITLLLYVGAALVVIAAGVFVGGSWEAISGVARFALVLGFALGFGWTGELFVRFTEKLKSAGQTFRTVGTILLPFAALAYERYVLNGNAPAWYWVVTGLGLAGVNYLLYRYSQKGRLTAYLAVFSLGVFALSLPNALKWGDGWFTAIMWFFAVGLFGMVWRLAPDGMALLRDFLRRGNDAIAESHFVLALLLLATGFFYWGQVQGSWNEAVTWAALTVVLVELALYYRAGWLAGVAALMAGASALHMGAAIAPTMAGAPTISLLVLAAGLMALAPFSPKRLGHGKAILTSVALFWVVVARLFPGAGYLDWVQSVAIVGYVGLPLVAAFRYRNPLLWSGVWVALNLAVMDGLSLFPPQPQILVPTLLYAAVAGLWLLVELRPPFAQLRTYARIFFVAQAVCLTLVLTFTMLSVALLLFQDVAMASAWGLTLLTLGWAWLTKRTQKEGVATATALQGVLSLIAILYYFQLPNHWISVVWVSAGAIALVVSGLLPIYARRVARGMGLLIAAIAPWTGILESLLYPTLESPAGLTTYTAQGVLAISTLLYLWQTIRHRSEWLTYVTTLFAFVLALWVSNDYLPAALFAPALLALGMGTLVVGRFAPAKAPYLMGIVGYGTVALAPFLGGSWAWLTQDAMPFWGLTFAAWVQLTLVGAVAVYTTGTVRRQSEVLAYGTTALIYTLVLWLGLDYLPAELLPPLLLGLGVLGLVLVRYTPAPAKPVVEGLGYITSLIAPFVGASLVPFSTGEWQMSWLGLKESMQLTLFGTTLVYIEGAVRQRESFLTYSATALVYWLVGWLSYDYLPSALFAPILLALGVSTLVVARYTEASVTRTLELLGYGVVLVAPFVGGMAGWWVDWDSQWLRLDITQWAQLTLVGSAITYGILTTLRHSERLTYITTGLTYLLIGWLSYDYLPPVLFAPMLLAMGIATIQVARYTPSGAPHLLNLLGYGVVLGAPFVGWYGSHLVDWHSQWLRLDITQWAQLALAGSAMTYGIATATRRSEVFAYLTTALLYTLVGWVSYDYLPSALLAPMLLAAGIVTLWAARYTPQSAPKVLELLGYGVVLAAPFLGEYLALLLDPTSVWLTFNPTQWAQLTLVGSTLTYGVMAALRRSELLTYITTALTYYLVGWLTYNYLSAAAFAPILLMMGLGTLLVARYTLAGAPKTLEGLGYGVVLAAPFAGWLLGMLVDANSYWFTIPFTAWVQATLGGTVLTYGVATMRRQSEPFTYMTATLSYYFIGWITLDYLPASWQAFVGLVMGVLTLAVATVVPAKARQGMTWIGYGVVLLSPLTELILGDFARLGSMAGVIQRGQFITLLAATVYGGVGWYRKKRELVAIGATLLYLFYAWVAMDQGVDEIQMYTVPLAVLLYGFSWLFRAYRSLWEVASLLVLLPAAALQTLGVADQLRYSLMLGLWGLVLLLIGIIQPRRMMVVGGSIALLFAALRQLWAVVSTLPTAAIIGLAGLVLIALAVTLTLTRERWMRRVEG
jgi:hypothetical protein